MSVTLFGNKFHMVTVVTNFLNKDPLILLALDAHILIDCKII